MVKAGDQVPLLKKKEIEQWYIRITNYADELLEELETLDEWPERVKNMQRQWIGKNNGTVISFELESHNGDPITKLDVFTTRPDTLFGATYVSIAPEHDQLNGILAHATNANACKQYIQESLKKQSSERSDITKEKTGINTGIMAIHPITNERIPLFIADYVLTDYGTGAVMAVPAHDERDHAFAKNYQLPIKQVIKSNEGSEDVTKSAFTDNGQLINSNEFNDLPNNDAKEKISQHLMSIGKGNTQPQFKLRDWLISRQRYWGTPIPMMFDNDGNSHPIPDSELPVTLPTDVRFDGNSNPIETSESFKTITVNGVEYTRETDTMDTFFDSSWYFLRYCDSQNNKLPFDKDLVNHFLPVDYYIGGIEHACLHLLYARFSQKALRDIGLHTISEPFKKTNLPRHGFKDGFKMSKSLATLLIQISLLKNTAPIRLEYSFYLARQWKRIWIGQKKGLKDPLSF